MLMPIKIQNSKNLIKNMIMIIIGIFIGIGLIALIGIMNKPSHQELIEIKKQYTLNYIKNEQIKIGYDCHLLRDDLKSFLRSDIFNAIEAINHGKHWNSIMSSEIKMKMGKIRDHYFACGLLYSAAQNVSWDGLNDINFTSLIDNEIITLNTFIRHGEESEGCNSKCVKNMSKKIEISSERILKLLGNRAISEVSQ